MIFENEEIKKKIPIKKIFSCNCLKTEKNCHCYKPKTEMLLKAKKKYKIDLKFIKSRNSLGSVSNVLVIMLWSNTMPKLFVL